MKSFKIILTLATVCVVILLACKKEQPGMQNADDPCACASEVSADFVIEERGWSSINEKFTETDTIYHPKNVRFRAKLDDAEYTWYIGAEVINDKSYMRFFDESTVEEDIKVTLVVKKEPNTLCFPNDDGHDSIIKTMHVSPYPILDWDNDTIIQRGATGVYRVKGPHLSDSFDINVWTSFGNDPLSTRVNITNFDGKGNNCIDKAELGDANYRQIWIRSVGSCYSLAGSIHNRVGGIVEMELQYNEELWDEGSKVYRTYYGRKIN